MHYRVELTFKDATSARRVARVLETQWNDDMFDAPIPECVKLVVREISEDED